MFFTRITYEVGARKFGFWQVAVADQKFGDVACIGLLGDLLAVYYKFVI